MTKTHLKAMMVRKELHQKLKILASIRDKSLQEILDEILTAALATEAQASK